MRSSLHGHKYTTCDYNMQIQYAVQNIISYSVLILSKQVVCGANSVMLKLQATVYKSPIALASSIMAMWSCFLSGHLEINKRKWHQQGYDHLACWVNYKYLRWYWWSTFGRNDRLNIYVEKRRTNKPTEWATEEYIEARKEELTGPVHPTFIVLLYV